MHKVGCDAFVHSVEYGGLTAEGVPASLLRWRADVNARHSQSGLTALHHAVRDVRSDLTTALLAAGANPNVRNNSGATATHWAVHSSAFILQMLIDAGGSVNTPSFLGETPLLSLVKDRCAGESLASTARLQALLAVQELELDVRQGGKNAEQLVLEQGRLTWARLIAEEVCGFCDSRLGSLQWQTVAIPCTPRCLHCAAGCFLLLACARVRMPLLPVCESRANLGLR
jgi:hypothetical protein